MLKDFAELLGLTPLDVFKQAHAMYGEDPDKSYKEWEETGIPSLPVYRFIEYKLKQLH